MTPFGGRRGPVRDPLDEGYGGPGAEDAAAAGPVPVDPAADPEAAHRQALVLSEVSAEGAVGLFRVLRRAASGDEDAASVPVSALLRAIPGMTLLDSHDFLLRAHIPPPALAGTLTAGQRVALVYVVDGTHVAPQTA
ncbi:hypothetical protein [Streptomyces sp. NRRL F-5123]|uniref:hypothetical protein n=1 Tax=Streptomyces sp. NRRL F-5123 TaxID=1463856 RepID=UPI00131AD067|nr:hypothetical protein [Streptomyces sp. NRRL F-5123]